MTEGKAQELGASSWQDDWHYWCPHAGEHLGPGPCKVQTGLLNLLLRKVPGPASSAPLPSLTSQERQASPNPS